MTAPLGHRHMSGIATRANRAREDDLTSDQRCEKAFKKRFGPAPELQPAVSEWLLNFEGWAACWKYLQSQAVKEFIER